MDPSAFQELSKATQNELHLMGGKAATLSLLLQKGFPVPPGFVVFQEPQTPEDSAPLLRWWIDNGSFPVAVRSSASGEDSSDFSYAGQFITLLHIQRADDLKMAVQTCFQAVHRSASKTYAAHFDQPLIPMHVLVQRMIQSQFSGVFFSVNPLANDDSWLVEVVEGQGEQLVSGQVTPFRFGKNLHGNTPKNWRSEYLQTIVNWGLKVESELGYKVDMEWAIDQEGHFWILQSRPITAQESPSNNKKIMDQEWQRLSQQFNFETSWDGHTFAELTGIPTELTFDIWQRTFQQGQAFDKALRSIGYEGLGHSIEHFSLLNRVYGRAYLNLQALEPVYFGNSPYRLSPHPRPHLQFAWDKLSPKILARAPYGLFKMAKIAWNIQTGRREIALRALELSKSPTYVGKDALALKRDCLRSSLTESQAQLKTVCDFFTSSAMQSTFLLTLLIESTTQGLMALMEKDLGADENHLSLQILTTEATTADQSHRGIGELELSHPRWIETHQAALKNNPLKSSATSVEKSLEELLQKISPLRRPIFKQEFFELRKLLQIREDIKNEVMKPYAQIRWLALDIESRLKLGPDIFWLNLNEILSLRLNQDLSAFRSLIQERKKKAQCFKSIDLPMTFSLRDLKNVLTDDSDSLPANVVTKGVSLSAGIAQGFIHIVHNPESENRDAWPEHCILVAEATDPGWTPLFAKAKGLIVSRGGILSHCAIVAREMGLPAVGEIRGATHLFKEGERVWIDGNHGTIRRDN